MTRPTITGRVFEQALLLAGDRVIAAREELCALDAAAGDGDLGATLAVGFGHVRNALDADPDGGEIGAMLAKAGGELARKAPSTIGALLATAFLRAGTTLSGVEGMQASEVAILLRVAATAVAERGGAAAGQRTILDAMLVAAEAAEAAALRGIDGPETLQIAATAAKVAAQATAEMEPQLGRAGWIKDRAWGTPDAGAVAWAIFLDGLADGCRVTDVREARRA